MAVNSLQLHPRRRMQTCRKSKGWQKRLRCGSIRVPLQNGGKIVRGKTWAKRASRRQRILALVEQPGGKLLEMKRCKRTCRHREAGRL